MNEAKIYKHYRRTNGFRWRVQGSIEKYFFKPRGMSYSMKIRKLAGKRILERKEANQHIAELIKRGEPFWVGRYGSTEMQFLNAVLYKRYIGGKTGPLNWDVESRLSKLCDLSGFFPDDYELGMRYAEACLKAAPNMDVHAIWNLWMEEYMIGRYEKNTAVMQWGDIAPYYQRQSNADVPWSSALKGKKVLVINPFVYSIEQQYTNNRMKIFDKIFPADMILPEFELKTLKSVQTLSNSKDERFTDWFDALQWMIEECKKIDFDVALIGCGAYGFLLADAIKNMGKGAIQTCGCTQMIFGVLGQRWMDDEALMRDVVNESWIRPSDSERIEGMDKVEGACYW